MHIVYICNFNLTRAHGGKDRATRQKIEALDRSAIKFKAYFIKREGRLYKLLYGTFLDLKCALYILMKKPDVLISRGATGGLSFLISKMLGVLTVREIHGVSEDEAGLIPYKGFRSKLIGIVGRFNSMMNTWADVRIFNHPFLLEYFKDRKLIKKWDFYCYNGHGDGVIADITMDEAKRKYGFIEGYRYLVFTGSVSEWHGVDYLVALQEQFNEHGDKVKIVVGGGGVSKYDENRVCINFTPLDEIGCSELIVAADACLMPVKNNRISPGSPLKLYDYIAHKKYIIAQDIIGYSDEVKKYKVGISVDFVNAVESRNIIVSFLERLQDVVEPYAEVKVSWDDRIQYWIKNLRKALNR